MDLVTKRLGSKHASLMQRMKKGKELKDGPSSSSGNSNSNSNSIIHTPGGMTQQLEIQVIHNVISMDEGTPTNATTSCTTVAAHHPMMNAPTPIMENTSTSVVDDDGTVDDVDHVVTNVDDLDTRTNANIHITDNSFMWSNISDHSEIEATPSKHKQQLIADAAAKNPYHDEPFQAMHEILQNLGDSFLNSTIGDDAAADDAADDDSDDDAADADDDQTDRTENVSPVKRSVTNTDDDDDVSTSTTTFQQMEVSPIKSVNEQDFDVYEDSTSDDDSINNNNNNLDQQQQQQHEQQQQQESNYSHDNDENIATTAFSMYPFPSGHDQVHQLVDSSLLQASLASSTTSSSDMVKTPSSSYTTNITSHKKYQQLRDRNASLIKEIRFAEQTCVEVSQEKRFLELEVSRLSTMVEEEFASKRALLEKFEYMAQQQQQQYESHNNNEDEELLECMSRELEIKDEQLVSLQASKLDLEEQLAKLRASKSAVKEHLNKALGQLEELLAERATYEGQAQKVDLEQTLLNQHSQRLSEMQEELTKERSSRIELQIDLDNERQRNQDAVEMQEMKRDLLSTSSNSNHQDNADEQMERLSMRIEELEAQNAFLKRQQQEVVAVADPQTQDDADANALSPDGVSPMRTIAPAKKEPVARKLQMADDAAAATKRLEQQQQANAVLERKVTSLIEELAVLQQNDMDTSHQQKQGAVDVDSMQTKLASLIAESELHLEEMKSQDATISSLMEESELHQEEIVRFQQDLSRQRQLTVNLEVQLSSSKSKLAQTQQENQLLKASSSSKLSINGLQSQLTAMEEELAATQNNCQSLERQLIHKDEHFALQRQLEHDALHDRFRQVLAVATQRMTHQASTMETTLLHKMEQYRIRIVNLTIMVETLRSNLDFDFSVDSQQSVSQETEDGAAMDATFSRINHGGAPTDVSLLQQMEEARLSSDDDLQASQILSDFGKLEDPSVQGWLKMMDISNVDDLTVIEVQKLQSSLAFAQEQITSHVETITILEGEIDVLTQDRRNHKNQLYQLHNSVSTDKVNIAELNAKLQSSENRRAFLESQLTGTADEMHELHGVVSSDSAKISTLTAKLSSSENRRSRLESQLRGTTEELEKAASTNQELEANLADNSAKLAQVGHLQLALEDAESEIDRLREAYVACNDKLAAAFEEMTRNESLIGRFKESSDEAVQFSKEAAESAREDTYELSSQLAALTVEKEQLDTRVSELEQTLVDTTDALEQVTEERNVARLGLQDLELRLSQTTNALAQASSDRDATNDDVEHMARERVDLEAKLRDSMEHEREKSVMVNEMRQSLANAEASLVDIQLEHNHKVKELEDARKDLSRATDASLESKTVIAKMTGELEQSRAEQEVLRQHAAKAEDSVERSTSEFTAYKRCMEERIVERQEVLREVQTFSETKHRDLRDKLVGMEKSKDDLFSEITEATSTFVNEVRDMASSSNQVMNRSGIVSASSASISSRNGGTWKESLEFSKVLVVALNDMLAASCNELSQRSDKIESLQRTVLSCETCIEDHEAAKSELETEISNEQQEIANLECQLDEARSELEQAGLEVAKTSSELTETRGALETLQGTFTEKTELAETLRGARDDAHARLVFLTGKLEEASRDENEAKSDVEELEALLTEHRGTTTRLQSRNQSLESKNQKLREYIRKLTSKCEEWQESWEEQNQVLLEMRGGVH